MKVTYIITPFEDAAYLIRCINAIYRQVGNGFDVILAENTFGEREEEICSYLQGMSGVRRIPDGIDGFEEKIGEAVRLVGPDSDYVMFVDVCMVISPVATRALLDCQEGAGLLFPAMAVRNGDKFEVEQMDSFSLFERMGQCPPQRFCFGRELFSRFRTEFFLNQYRFRIFIFSACVEKVGFGWTDDICFYTDGLSAADGQKQEFEEARRDAFTIVDKLGNVEDMGARLSIFGSMVSMFLEYMEGDKDSRNAAYTVLQELGAKVEGDLLLRKYLEQNLGCEAEVFRTLDYTGYRIYRERFAAAGNGSVTMADMIPQGKQLGEVKAELAEVRKEIAVLNKNQHLAMAGIAKVQEDTGKTLLMNPILEVPKLYAEGRLGFRVLWRCFCGWVSFKCGRGGKGEETGR